MGGFETAGGSSLCLILYECLISKNQAQKDGENLKCLFEIYGGYAFLKYGDLMVDIMVINIKS